MIFNFNNTELSVLCPWDTQVQLGIVAQRIILSVLKNGLFKRVGVRLTEDTKYEYDTLTGQIIIYQPKHICNNCNNKMAKFSYNKREYCEGCIKLLKDQLAEQQAPKKSKQKEVEVKSK